MQPALVQAVVRRTEPAQKPLERPAQMQGQRESQLRVLLEFPASLKMRQWPLGSPEMQRGPPRFRMEMRRVGKVLPRMAT